MKILGQLSLHVVQVILYGLAGILVFYAIGLGLTVIGLPLVPLVLAAAVALAWLARHLGQDGQSTGAAGHSGPA
ncbi:hypothetical protein [Streptomyces venezuelae]|uniref:hypothetical protein n=1 Tax=Streptomyces venezuelae TaxID=54571 RepID=UPI0037AF9005